MTHKEKGGRGGGGGGQRDVTSGGYIVTIPRARFVAEWSILPFPPARARVPPPRPR